MKKIILNENVNLHILKTNKFKDVSIQIGFLDNGHEYDQLKRLFLAMILSDTCNLYNTKKQVSNLMSNLYDARFSIFPEVRGMARILEVQCSVINGKYVNDTNLLKKQFALLNEFLLNPIFKYREYPYDLFEEIKNRLRLIINSENDNPSSYAFKQANILFGEYMRVKSDYNLKALDDIKMNEIIKLYDFIINKTAIDIFVVGDIEENEIIKYCNTYLNFKGRKVGKNLVYKAEKLNYDEKTEERILSQSQLQLRYTTNKTALDGNYFAMLIGNGILGGLPTSLMFQEIREKRSLCYNINSVANGYDGTLRISTGINYKNLQQVKSLIKDQIVKVQKGDFDDELLQITKKMYINIYRQSSDNIKSLMWDAYRNTLIDDGLTLKKSIEKIKEVSKEDIKEVFQDVVLKVCYVLKQKEIFDE